MSAIKKILYESVKTVSVQSSNFKKKKKNKYYCKKCKCRCNSEQQYKQHKLGNKHNNKIEQG